MAGNNARELTAVNARPLGMSQNIGMKYIIAIAAIVTLVMLMGLPARAQFRPCVWPNTCSQ